MVARPPAVTNHRGSAQRDLKLVTFKVGHQDYGIDVEDIHAVYHSVPLIPAFEPASFVSGYLQLSDSRIPVLDMRKLLGIPPVEQGKLVGWVIAVHDHRRPVGFIVDTVGEVIHLNPSALEPAHKSAEFRHPIQITGMVKSKGRDILIPDLLQIVFEVN